MAIHILKYVPECPRCGSKNTGFEVYGTYDDIHLKLFFANRGMKIEYKYYPCKDMCFCDDCKYEWMYHPKWKILKKEEYIQLREDKHLKEFIKEIKEIKEEKKKEEE